MVQILAHVPTFGEKLADSLARTAETAGNIYQQRQAQSNLDKLLNPPQGNIPNIIPNNPGQTPSSSEIDQTLISNSPIQNFQQAVPQPVTDPMARYPAILQAATAANKNNPALGRAIADA